VGWRQFHGWRIVGAGALMSAVGSALVIQGFSAYSVLLREEFGWSTGVIAVAFALNRAESGLLGPIQGLLIDRFGPRRVLQLGALVMAGGLFLFSQVQNIWQFFLFYPVVAIGVALAGFLTHVTTVVNWFERRRSLAIAIYMGGFALGGLMTPGVVWYLERYGWRTGAKSSALVVVVVLLPLSLVFHHRPGDLGQHVDGLDPQDADPESESTHSVNGAHFTAAEALRTKAFWFISFGHMTALLVVSSVLAHLALYLTDDRGLSLQEAGFIVGALPVLQLVGQFAGGWIGDRYDKRRLAAGCMASHVVALLILAHGGSMWAVAAFLPLHGVAWGLRGPLMQSIRADYFGATAFGQILGYSSMIVMIGSVVGPLLAGILNDATGSYTLGFTIIAALASTGVALFLAATPPEPARGATVGPG
jgi:MFS family permease